MSSKTITITAVRIYARLVTMTARQQEPRYFAATTNTNLVDRGSRSANQRHATPSDRQQSNYSINKKTFDLMVQS